VTRSRYPLGVVVVIVIAVARCVTIIGTFIGLQSEGSVFDWVVSSSPVPELAPGSDLGLIARAILIGILIASVLVVWVVQKRREIGILRAMGATRGSVQRVFLLQGAIVAAGGSLIGSLLASAMLFVFLRLARAADGTPLFELISMPPWLYFAAIAGAIAGGVAAAALPARAAARLDPAQAIRM